MPANEREKSKNNHKVFVAFRRKAKIGKKWIQGEIQAELTSCQ